MKTLFKTEKRCAQKKNEVSWQRVELAQREKLRESTVGRICENRIYELTIACRIRS